MLSFSQTTCLSGGEWERGVIYEVRLIPQRFSLTLAFFHAVNILTEQEGPRGIVVSAFASWTTCIARQFPRCRTLCLIRPLMDYLLALAVAKAINHVPLIRK